MRIEGSVVLVTGASEGIGAACVAELQRRGARVALVARTESRLKALAGRDDLVITADLADPATRSTVVAQALAHFGRIDILINNAGLGVSAPAWRAPDEQVRYMFEVNFFAALELIQAVVPTMKKQRSGMIVNVGSTAGKIAMPWFTLYSATKFALGALTNGLRMELAHHGIRALIVCPGFVRTEFHRHVLGGPPNGAERRGRPGEVTAEECARAIMDGIERNKRTVVIPRIAWALIVASRLFPVTVDNILRRANWFMSEEQETPQP